MDDFDIPIFKKAYHLFRDFHSALKNFPKSEKYILGGRCEEAIVDIIMDILKASQSPRTEKAGHLDKASIELNLLRVYIRLAKDIKALDNGKYISFQESVDEVGRMLGGWRRSLRD